MIKQKKKALPGARFVAKGCDWLLSDATASFDFFRLHPFRRRRSGCVTSTPALTLAAPPVQTLALGSLDIAHLRECAGQLVASTP